MVDGRVINIAQEYIQCIAEKMELKKAFLFGSQMNGNANEESDIDIALVIANMPDLFTTQQLLMRLRRKIDLRIEPHPIEEKNFREENPFAHEIQKKGLNCKSMQLQ